jgi:predicted 3-demethylubiquinone-9 3-methyltransferase (glyoxalase superfamily)
MPAITPMLWFDTQAEEAAKFYTSVFKNSRIRHVVRYGDAGPGPKGSAMVVDFELDGQRFTGLNGGAPQFKFTEAVSFVIHCTTQDEVDDYWTKLTSGGGQESMCGWLKDKFGLSWQVVPDALIQMLSDPDPKKAKRATEAMYKMKKLDIAAAKKAYEEV